MLIYSSVLDAKPGKSGALVSQVAALRDVCADASGQQWTAWMAVSGRPFGSFMLATRYDSHAQMIEAGQQIGASAGFQKLSGELAQLLDHPAETGLSEVVGMTGPPSDPKPFVIVTRAVLAGGHLVDGLAWSNKVLGHVTDVTGVGGILTISAAGQMQLVTWLAGVDTAEEIDTMSGKVAADADYLSMVDEAGGFFVPGSAERAVIAMLP